MQNPDGTETCHECEQVAKIGDCYGHARSCSELCPRCKNKQKDIAEHNQKLHEATCLKCPGLSCEAGEILESRLAEYKGL